MDQLRSGEEQIHSAFENQSQTDGKSDFDYSAQDVILYALSGNVTKRCDMVNQLRVTNQALLAVGVNIAEPSHLSFLYEASDQFITLPTFGTTIALNAVFEHSIIQEAIERYQLEDNFIRVCTSQQSTYINIAYSQTLHGEQYLKLYKPLPTSGRLISKPKIIDVLDKGSGALILIEGTPTNVLPIRDMRQAKSFTLQCRPMINMAN